MSSFCVSLLALNGSFSLMRKCWRKWACTSFNSCAGETQKQNSSTSIKNKIVFDVLLEVSTWWSLYTETHCTNASVPLEHRLYSRNDINETRVRQLLPPFLELSPISVNHTIRMHTADLWFNRFQFHAAFECILPYLSDCAWNDDWCQFLLPRKKLWCQWRWLCGNLVIPFL